SEWNRKLETENGKLKTENEGWGGDERGPHAACLVTLLTPKSSDDQFSVSGFLFPVFHFSSLMALLRRKRMEHEIRNRKRETENRKRKMGEHGMRGDDIAGRLVALAVRVVKIVDTLPETPAGKHVAGQLLRSGTSPGANYEEARGAESRRDFVHKIGVAL